MASVKGKIAVSARGKTLYRLWKPLLVLAVLIPVGAIAYYWIQMGFDVTLSFNVSDGVTSNVAVYAAFLGLIALSFIIQYYYGDQKTRKNNVRARTPVLVLLGLSVGIVAVALRWWINPSASPRSIISYIVHKPLVTGSAIALVVSGLALAFFLSTREEQRRVLRAALIFLAAFLIFGGPTYLIYVLQNFGLPYPVLVFGGLIAFVVGVLLLLRLIGKSTKLGVFG